MPEYKQIDIQPESIAKYFLYRGLSDGDYISPLKMQKLVYYAYVWSLVEHRVRLFNERIQAWPNGAVVSSLYQSLKTYGSQPIGEDFLGGDSKQLEGLFNSFPPEVKETLDEVYEKYGILSAFELVMLTHSEGPWTKARQGLAPTESSNKEIEDGDILEQYKLE